MSEIQVQPARSMAEGKPAARVADLAQRLLEGGLSELSVREQRVISTIVDRHHVTRSVNRAVDDDQTIGDHIADRVARFGVPGPSSFSWWRWLHGSDSTRWC